MQWVKGRLDALEWWRAVRYSAASAIGVVVTQALLVLAHGVLGVGATWANVAAVMLAAVPVFALNRAWVWQLTGPSSLRREVLPFWGFTLAGLGCSTAAVSVVATVSTSTLAVSAANIGAFGALWMAKFFVLDEIVFAPVAADELVVGTP